MPGLTRSPGWLALSVLILARAADAQQTQDLPFTFDGPPPPVPPAVIARDDAGRATIRAVRLTSPLRLDGQLDEEIYSSVPSASGMIQIEP